MKLECYNKVRTEIEKLTCLKEDIKKQQQEEEIVETVSCGPDKKSHVIKDLLIAKTKGNEGLHH